MIRWINLTLSCGHSGTRPTHESSIPTLGDKVSCPSCEGLEGIIYRLPVVLTVEVVEAPIRVKPNEVIRQVTQSKRNRFSESLRRQVLKGR